ncbi:peptidoglycan D,D-transpeptidase FtsI family protein [Solicola sp. PLA-1-18]|uniref:peptidoglycan D,D-transpeptidase FtsI family protein n=1 Tax=Solicola sp. PLA-1-18 TaxID=3380532 RepID=UPI003B7CC8AF
MNRPIRVLAIGCLALFVALMLNVNYLQFVEADSLNAKNGNRRVMDEEFSRDRGAILVGGKAIAESVPSDDDFQYQRQYPEGKLWANLTGYYSYIYGRSALERSQNGILSGSDNRLFVNRVVDLIGSRAPQGGSVSLTLDRAAQQAAAEGLENLPGNAKGAAVALDPETGAVLAMVGAPTYDPNRLASHDLQATTDAWQRLQANENDPMINRATQQILPPGSTFKLVTAAAAMTNLNLKPDSEVQAGSSLSFPGIGYRLVNEGGGNCGGEQITLERALAVSCNVSFGSLAGRVGQDALAEQARKFGFGEDYLEGLPANASQFTTQPNTDLEAPQLAQSGIGQYEVSATPLQMAMVTAAIANGGDLMRPYVVSNVRAPDLSVLDSTEPDRIGEAVSSDVAAGLQQMMVETVRDGTAGSAAIGGATVGGKTGTAQSTADRPPYAWFTSFAKLGDRQVAVAVVVESTDTSRPEISGGRLAGPIARSVMQAVLDR